MRYRLWIDRSILLLAVFICFVLGFPSEVRADISNVSVTPIIDSSDITDRFQLIVKPGDVRSVTVSFTNFSSSPIVLKAVPRNASTSDQGKIIYSQDTDVGDNRLTIG